MFYSQFILAKKGPLGTIWIAAHLERKLRKNQVADTDIGVSVDSILFPEVPIALRLSSHLLLGVVRIYSRKVNYLFDDCSEALLKIKQAFRSTAVDLPPEESTAPYHSITLPETFDLDDFELPDNEIFQGNFVDHHVSTREQITLQDKMDGVVYSTSQFGLDERFGDGDTSQIGLDLDEELFLDRAATAQNEEVSVADPQAAVEGVTAPAKDTRNKEITHTSETMLLDDQIEVLPANAEFNEYAQAPPTPGLVEVPNLSSVQEALACDDHMELEDQLVATNTVENASSELELHRRGKNATDWSSQNNLHHESTVPISSNENGELEKQTKNQGDSPPNSMAVEYSSVNERIVAPHGLDVKHLNDGAVSTLGQTDGECVESPCCSHVTSELEDHGRTSNMPEAHNDAEVANTVKESCLSDKALAADVACPLESPGRPTVIDVEARASEEPKDPETLNSAALQGDTLIGCQHVLQPYSSHFSLPDFSSPGGVDSCSVETARSKEALHASGASAEMQGEEECHVTGVIEGDQISHSTSHGETQAGSRKSDEQLDNVLTSDSQLEISNRSATSDLPPPEKVLSVPEGDADKPNDFLVESTPDKEVLAGSDGVGAGTKLVSGKKRTFTESTLTVESLNSVESVGVTRSRRTAESIPDDDDLLSSILVGKRSSVLKMKPTPLLELASTKRIRSAPRSTASKRKVLMDDTMVLHGDIIRQQLTNTEDIRRIRKKAPCTRPEILMIQRQFLEDAIFNDPIFTGMSAELVSLHCETHNLSGVIISENDHASSEVVKDVECSGRPNFPEESGMEGSTAPVVLRNDVQKQPVETPFETESHQAGEHDIDAQGQTKPVSDSLQHDPMGEKSGMEIGRVGSEVADEADLSAIHGELLLPAGATPGDICEVPIGEKADVLETSMQMGEYCKSPDQKMDREPLQEGASVIDVSNGDKVDHIECVEYGLENIVAVETDSKVRDELLLDETKVGTSVAVSDVQTDVSTPVDNGSNYLVATSPEIGEPSNMVLVNGDRAVGDGDNQLELANQDGVQVADLGHDSLDPAYNGMCNEDAKMDCTYSAELDIGVKGTSVNDGENPLFEEVDPLNAMDKEIASHNHSAMGDNAEWENVEVRNDTEFLNVDDDEIAEDDDDGMPCDDDTQLPENSGWSSRTRAVAKYLQTAFDREAVHGRKVLSMDHLLAGKTRKEASRMFFETLVLKTRDYIHVEQPKPFDNISIKPRVKLMKSDF